jgi:invasion protein IalB
MKINIKLALLAVIVTAALIDPGYAQQPAPAPKAKAAPRAAQPVPAPAAPATPPAAAEGAPPAAPPSGWVARCTSASRAAPLECAIEETAVFTKTGQIVVLVNIRVPSDTHAPVLLVQLPLGLDLPAGAKLQIDEGKVTDLPIQTCETRGCYASIPIPADLLAALKSGQQMKVSFQSMSKEPAVIPLPLGNFATVYDKIK